MPPTPSTRTSPHILARHVLPAWTRYVTAATLRGDIAAGLTGAAVVLPQGVAFAAIAGLPPEYGLYTAMVTPVVAALFGSSMIMVSGPATAICAVVFAALAPLAEPGSASYISMAITLALLTGACQLVFGLVNAGKLAAFVSHSVMLGFTAAAAVLIGVSQLRGALGVEAEGGGTAVERLARLGSAARDGVSPQALAVAGFTMAVALLCPRLHRRLPAYLVALIAGTAFAQLAFDGLDSVGALPSVLPVFSPVLPSVDDVLLLSESAIAIALIGLLEAITIGRAFAPRTDMPFSANREIIGQGLSNIVGSAFQAFPGSGSFTRSGLNYEAGARTPVAAIAASFALIALLFLIAPFLASIPIAAVSGLILVVAARLIRFDEIRHIMRTSRSDAIILFVTFGMGILVDLEFAILAGVTISLAHFIHRTMQPRFAIGAPDPSLVQRTFRNAENFNLPECPQMLVCRFDGPLYFGSAEMLRAEFRRISEERPRQKVILITMKGVNDIDLAGTEAIADEARRRRRLGGDLYLVARSQPFIDRLRRLGLLAVIGEDHILPDKHFAVAQIVPTLDPEICRTCEARIFHECARAPGGAAD